MANIITIDGPSASGKSTIGLLFAQKIGYQFIDSGIFYRLGSLLVLKYKVPLNDIISISKIFKKLNPKFNLINGRQAILIEDENVTSILHSEKVNKITPILAAYKQVRDILKIKQQKIGSISNTIMAGRDIGSEIFPESKLKFYITASPEVRAKRRFKSMSKENSKLTYEQVLEETKKRDYQDSTRLISPLRIPDKAIIIDTTKMNIEKTLKKLEDYYINSPIFNA